MRSISQTWLEFKRGIRKMLQYLGRKEEGFTLMELLIAVAIVVILAGVGIPVYLKFMTGTKLAEASTNLAGIKLSEQGYKLANGVYLSCDEAPRAATAVDENTFAWSDRPADDPATQSSFDDIDFTVSGDVRFVYAVVGDANSFTAGALGDTDGDGDQVLFLATDLTSPGQVTAAAAPFATATVDDLED
jgi:prepilin-type N-terminal cleavage/methylation domain-containing protein